MINFNLANRAPCRTLIVLDTRRSGSTLTRADLPGFPVWRGPMGQAIRTAQAMSSSQHNQHWSGPLSGAYNVYPPQMHVRPFPHSAPLSSQPFPPTPLTHRPPTFVTSSPLPPSIPASQPSQPCPLTHPCPPTPPQPPLFRLSFGLHSGLYEHSHFLHTCSHLHL